MGFSPDDPVWDPTTFTKNRDRLQNGEVFAKFMTKLLNHPQIKPLLSAGNGATDLHRQRAEISADGLPPDEVERDVMRPGIDEHLCLENRHPAARQAPGAAVHVRRRPARRGWLVR